MRLDAGEGVRQLARLVPHCGARRAGSRQSSEYFLLMARRALPLASLSRNYLSLLSLVSVVDWECLWVSSLFINSSSALGADSPCMESVSTNRSRW